MGHRRGKVSRVRRAVVIGVVIGLVVAGPASARASDQAQAKRFITAATTLTTAAIASHQRTQRAVDRLVAHVTATCPGALAMAPANGTPAQEQTKSAIDEEGLDALALATVSPYRQALEEFARQEKHLRWNSPTVKRAFARFGQGTDLELRLTPPDLCRDIAAAAASAFNSAPPEAIAFVAAVGAADGPSKPTVTGLANRVKPYVAAADRPAYTRLRKLLARETRLLTQAFTGAYTRLSDALAGK